MGVDEECGPGSEEADGMEEQLAMAQHGQTISFPLSFPFALFLLGREAGIGMPHMDGRES